MKPIYFYLVGISTVLLSLPLSVDVRAQDIPVNKQLALKEEHEFKAYEDSLLRVLYPPVEAKTAEGQERFAQMPRSPSGRPIPENTYVPTSVTIDKSKAVGEIPIQTGVSPSGAKTYTVPIQVYPGMNGFEPQLSLTYNSQQGNGVAGVGWGVGGYQTVTRTNKSIHYDGKSQGPTCTKSDAFVLDGTRLIKISENATNIYYESEQGNIKVKGFLSGNIVKYFEVYYPNGLKGVFGYTSNGANQIFYPLTTLSDLRGNKIVYTYTAQTNRYKLTKVSYNGASVEFVYQASRPDPLLSFAGGLRLEETSRLTKIISKFGATELCSYDLTYSVQNNCSVLSQIAYSASGQSLNPLRFYYGEGMKDYSYRTSTTNLLKWYVSDEPSRVKVVRGRFDYSSGSDGLITLPNENPYWEHYRPSNLFQHSQNRYDNRFTGDEEIYLYAGLKNEYATPMPNLKTGANFIDIFCADLTGKQEEYIIKVNNGVSRVKDQVIFSVYKADLFNGVAQQYTRSYNFPTVLIDSDGGLSVHAKFYHTGDFNGDGKQEILAISCHNPFGRTDKISQCYVFDLEGNKILYQNHLIPYYVNFIGTMQSNPEDSSQKTDRLFVMDYDGDGKSDIIHINEAGVHVYTFDISGTVWTGRKVATYSGLTKKDLKDRSLQVGELNGDGMMDLLLSPPKKVWDFTWTVYNSTGNGQFYKSTFSGDPNTSDLTSGFLMQDVNGDGMSDLIGYYYSSFHTYLTKKNSVGLSECLTNYTSKSILIPTNINSHNYFSQLLSLKNGVVTKFSFPRNDNKGILATGMANSLGVVEKNTYQLINEEAITYGTYVKGNSATFPYADIQEAIPVVVSSATYMKGSRVDYNSFWYQHAIIHRQGLGFRGFEIVACTNQNGQNTTQTFDPYRYGVMTSEVSPEVKNTYNFSVNLLANKIVKVRLSNKTEQNLPKNITVSTGYVYDTYGNPTQEMAVYTGGIARQKVNTYYNNTADSAYLIGFLTNQVIASTRGSTIYTERMNIPSHKNGYPNSKVLYKDGNKVEGYEYTYDAPGNMTKEIRFLYSSTSGLTTTHVYDGYGRLTKTTNPLNLSNQFVYNAAGRMSSEKDHYGKTTTHTYDPFGRETATTFPDNTAAASAYAWSENGTNALYAVTRSATGKPTVTAVYDALNREVRNCETRFNGSILKTDQVYDLYGRVEKKSLPFPGSTATHWITYSYDIYDRPLTISEPSGRKTTYAYSGNSVTTVEDGISVQRTFDALDNLVSVKDPAGTISYAIRPDGQPASLVAPGNVTTSFGYDGFGRRTSLADPSAGTTVYAYDASGNISKETDANGKAVSYTYDAYNRLKTEVSPEFTTTYTYNAYDAITGVSSTNGTSSNYTYDEFGRLKTLKETGVDGKYLQRDYTYVGGNVSSIKYISQSGALTTENYLFANGHLTEIKLNNQTSIFKLTQENGMGLPTEVRSGIFSRTYGYDSYGFPTSRKIQKSDNSVNYQNFAYRFDPVKQNLLTRQDLKSSPLESFAYDNMNRLVAGNGFPVSYDAKGNILTKGDISGSFTYNTSGKPYAISAASAMGGTIPSASQVINYTSFKRPNTITQDGNVATFTYNAKYQRVKMHVAKGGVKQLTRYYLGDCYEIDETPSGTKEKLYLAGENYYNASAVLVKENTGGWQLCFIGRDYMGSITHVLKDNGQELGRYNFDAWGRSRNVQTLAYLATGEDVNLYLGRGYGGHEHLALFGLVNMNARLYDPMLGRFLSPDPFVQAPDLSQNFNRYSYALNNPLRYVDENGEFVHIIIGIVVGGVINLVYKAASGQLYSVTDCFVAFGIGAVAGAAGAATGGFAFAAAGGAAGGIGGFLAGAVGGGASSGVMMPLQSIGNTMYFGDPFMNLKDYGLGILGGALAGGIGNGTIAALKGTNFWTGKEIQFGRGAFSFNNTPLRSAPEMKMLEAPKPSLNSQSIENTSFPETSQPSSDASRFISTPEGTTIDLQPTISRIQSGELYTFRHDGSIYYNKEGLLPKLSNSVYREYVHPTPGITNRPGAMRIITGGNSMWFTPDHYKTIIRIKF